MSNPAEVHYRPSLVVHAGKAVLSGIGRITPASWYRVLYRLVHNLYRRVVRLLYLRFWVGATLRGDVTRRTRSRAVLKVMPHSLVGWTGLEATYDAVSTVNRETLLGSIVECGVAQGGSAALMALADRAQQGNRRIWLFDSYEGLPDPTAEDYESGITGTHARPLVRGSCLGTLEQVSDLLFRELRLDPGKITLVKGWFQETLPERRGRIGPVALLRVDADWYDSVKCCLDNLFDLVVPGGFVIIDDYGSCFGAQKAVDQFLEARAIRVAPVHDGRGGCLFRKPA
jgi:macrocin-O-methyltransferase TylF-like protien